VHRVLVKAGVPRPRSDLGGGYQEGMEILALILLIAALVCFLIAAFAPPAWTRPGMVPLGLACWVLTVIIDAANRLHA
jgi:hypothetical protein